MRGSALVAGLGFLLLFSWGQQGQAELREAHLEIRGSVLELNPPALWDGRELWLPVQHLHHLGVEVERKGDVLRLLTLPENSPAARLMLAEKCPDSKAPPALYAPVRDLVRRLGGYTRWDEQSLTLTVLAYLRSARLLLESGQVEMETTFPVRWRMFPLNDPPRIVIDLVGCALPDNPPVIEGTHADLETARIAQFDPRTVRIVLELNTLHERREEGVSARWQVAFSQSAKTEGSHSEALPSQSLSPSTNPEGDPRTEQEQTISEGASDSPEAYSEPTAPSPPPFQLPTLEHTLQGVQIRLPISEGARPRMLFLEDPLRIVLELPGYLQEPLEQGIADESLFVRAVRAIPMEGGLVRLVFELSRAVSANLLPGKDSLALNLRLPRNAGGTLRQKVVVIDPGHGGNQAGARWGSILEKDITLSIGLKVTERLAQEGASVIITRAEDVAIGLYERTTLANHSSAHFFISIHCDSNPRPNSASGTTIYYHREDADSRALGQAILNEIVKVSGLPSRGVRSDTTLYQNGLAVLRTSQMPAVLIEVGFLNHSFDRAKLVNPKFQERIAEAIVRGLKAYVESQ